MPEVAKNVPYFKIYSYFPYAIFFFLHQTLRTWLGTQFSQRNPELGPLQAKFGTYINPLTKKLKLAMGKV